MFHGGFSAHLLTYQVLNLFKISIDIKKKAIHEQMYLMRTFFYIGPSKLFKKVYISELNRLSGVSKLLSSYRNVVI